MLPKVIGKGMKAEQGTPAVVQNKPVEPNMPGTIANFEGINNVDGVLPPDTNGDIGVDPSTGTKYYMQWVNLSLQIWDVTDPVAPVSLYGPVDGNTLFSGFGGACETTNDGDPIVLFDHLANRWLASQFALPGPFYQCIAISQTADPTGAWYRYEFLYSNTLMNDYPKFGVWPDGYYMSVNQFDGSSFAWEGAGAVAFERDAMLVGDPADMVYFDLGAVTRELRWHVALRPGRHAAPGWHAQLLRRMGRQHLAGRPDGYPAHLGVPCGLGQPGQLHLWPQRQL